MEMAVVIIVTGSVFLDRSMSSVARTANQKNTRMGIISEINIHLQCISNLQ